MGGWLFAQREMPPTKTLLSNHIPRRHPPHRARYRGGTAQRGTLADQEVTAAHTKAEREKTCPPVQFGLTYRTMRSSGAKRG